MKNNSIYPENKVRLKGLPLVTAVETTSPEILYISNKLNMIPKLVYFTSGSFNDGQRVNEETKWSIFLLSKTSKIDGVCYQQECIPVGCVPSDHWPYPVVSAGEAYVAHMPPHHTCPPCHAHPLSHMPPTTTHKGFQQTCLFRLETYMCATFKRLK